MRRYITTIVLFAAIAHAPAENQDAQDPVHKLQAMLQDYKILSSEVSQGRSQEDLDQHFGNSFHELEPSNDPDVYWHLGTIIFEQKSFPVPNSCIRMDIKFAASIPVEPQDLLNQLIKALINEPEYVSFVQLNMTMFYESDVSKTVVEKNSVFRHNGVPSITCEHIISNHEYLCKKAFEAQADDDIFAG